MPTISTYLSDELVEKIKERAASKYYRGKVSAYLADIIEQAVINPDTNQSMTPDERREMDKLKTEMKNLVKIVTEIKEAQAAYMPTTTKKTRKSPKKSS